MKDKIWHAAYQAILPMLSPADVVLAPRGDWPGFPCAANFYDGLISLQDETVLFLHCDRLGGIKKEMLAAVYADWQCIYANSVFAVFARSKWRWHDVRHDWRRVHCRKLHRYLWSRRMKQRQSTVYYIHIPKTGGTSAWSALWSGFKSSIYYTDMHAFLANPPQPGEYDLVGIHFSPSLLRGILRDDDHVVGLLREPTARFLSGVLHARRGNEDPETFSPSQRAMRTMRLADFVQTGFGSYETRVQLVALGTDYRRPFESYPGPVMLDNAMAFLEREKILFSPSGQADRLMQQLSESLGIRIPRPPHLNTNDPGDYARYRDEIREALPAIERKNALERQLYDAICAQFERQEPASRAGRARAIGVRYGNPAPQSQRARSSPMA